MKRLCCMPAVVLAVVTVLFGPVTYAQSILAAQGGVQVSAADITFYIQENVPPERRSQVLAQDKLMDLVESLYVVRVLAQEAAARPTFDKELAAWSANMKYQRQLVADYRSAYITEHLGESDWEALALEVYKAESGSFMAPLQIRASHILVEVKDKERSDKEALALAGQLRERAVAGEDFAALATEFTDEPAGREKGGDLGFFARGRMVPEFEAAAFALQNPGDISAVVKTQFGYHIIKLVERRPPGKQPFASVKDEIIEGLQQKLGNQVWQDKVIAIRSGLRGKVDTETLEKFAEDYKSSQAPD